MTNDFAALQIFLPMLAAPICIILSRFGKTAWVISMCATWSVAAMCLFSFGAVYASGEPLKYHMGGWAPPIGIELHIDLLAASMLVLVSSIAAITMPYFFRSVNDEIPREQQPFFYAAFLMCLSGLLGIISTHDAFNLYVFLEISSLSSYMLIAMGRDRRALAAAFQYLMLGTIGATMILIGIGFLYLTTGTLNMSDIAARIDVLAPSRALIAAFTFFAIGLVMKVALFPLHVWLPNAYAYAPSAVSPFLAAVGTKVAFYAVLRISYSVFGHEFSFSGMHLALIFTALAVPAILIGSVVAIFETNLKRMLAFSSVAQVGYITLGIGLASQTGLSASLLQIFNHAMTKSALFLALGAMTLRLGGNVTVHNIRGLGKRMPLTAFAFVLAGFGLIGMPFTGGFLSKWYLMKATLDGGWWLLTVLIAISSIFAVIYIWRVVEAMYFGRLSAQSETIREAPASMLVPIWLLSLCVILLGFFGNEAVEISQRIADQLMPSPSLPDPFSFDPPILDGPILDGGLP